MAKKAILDVLEGTIGRYVLNLDAQSLNVAVWKGEIELNNLELNVKSINNELDRQALESPNLAAPFRVKGGKFESLRLDVPWSRISNKPVLFKARGLTIIIEPLEETLSKELKVEGDSHAIKNINPDLNRRRRKQALDESEEARLRSIAIRDLAESDDETDHSSFGSRLVRRIIENLQVDVDDIHIGLSGYGATAGVEVKSISLSTTDENGRRTFVDRVSGGNSFLHKALKITGFGIYCDVDGVRSNQQKGNVRRERSYVLSPLSFDLTLRQSDSVKCIEFPKYLIQSELSNVSISFSKNQLELVNNFFEVAQPSQQLGILYPEYRPHVPIIKETCKFWWKYAVRCIGRLTKRTLWREFFVAFQKRQKYISAYRRSVYGPTCNWIKPLPVAEKKILGDIEMDTSISIEGIIAWRNIADAQVKRERKNLDDERARRKNSKKKPAYMSLFSGKKTDGELAESDDFNSIPSLSSDELKEIEYINLENISDAVLSADSKLCIVKFTLSSFKIDLVKTTSASVARLKMGTVGLGFDANNDGSYKFSFNLSDMQVDDNVTNRSLFPSVLRSVQSPTSTSKYAFEFFSSKSKDGDQDIFVRLVAFELVASPHLIREVKEFFTLKRKPYQSEKYTNPMLHQSTHNSSVIMFYDAIDNVSSASLTDDTTTAAALATSVVSDKLSSALSDAWNEKKERKRKWKMDFDIHAPIFVIPGDVSDPYATVLVFDLGHLRAKLKDHSNLHEVEEWFAKRMEKNRYKDEVDHWSIDIKNLTFVIGKAGNTDWRKSLSTKAATLISKPSEAIIEPMSISLYGSIENAPNDKPLTFVSGVLPSISLIISPYNIQNILSVYYAWNAFVEEFQGKKQIDPKQNSEIGGAIILEESCDEDLDSSFVKESIVLKESTEKKKRLKGDMNLSKQKSSSKEKDYLHISLALRRLSCRVNIDIDNYLEAHLVSVIASTSSFYDGTLSNRLRMGWFWIFDGLQSNTLRVQRLVIHSELPKSAASYSANGVYSMLEDLKSLGAFNESFSGSADLADISLKKNPPKKCVESGVQNELGSDTILEALFSSLFIKWNPKAIKELISVHSEIIAMLEQSSSSYDQNKKRDSRWKISVSTSQRFLMKDASALSTKRNLDRKPTSSRSQVKAKMKKLELSLNSAKDDRPLFILTMADSILDLAISDENIDKDNPSTKASFSVGNIGIITPKGRTHHTYNTIIGLAPNQTASILSINYFSGREALRESNLTAEQKEKYGVFMEVNLSPMRIVYIQSQILTLVEFVTEGVLGTLTAQAASTAKAATIEVTSTKEQQLFNINANSIDLVLPQSADSTNNLKICAGKLVVWYKTLPDNSGAAAKVLLNEVAIACNEEYQILDRSIAMKIDVLLPSNELPTIEQRAMRIVVDFSRALFLLSQSTYSQVLSTLSRNIGEPDSFLRSEIDIYGTDNEQSISLTGDDEQLKSTGFSGSIMERMTHAGVSAVENINRMSLSFSFAELGLELGGIHEFEPIVLIAAVKTSVVLNFLPDKEEMSTKITLHNLEVKDRRTISMQRHFSSIVSQVKGTEKEDVFSFACVSTTDGSMSLDLIVGSPQVVILPDALTEIIDFFNIQPVELSEGAKLLQENKLKKDQTSNEKSRDTLSDADKNLRNKTNSSTNLKISKYKVNTSDCRLVLIDMGCGSMANSHHLSSLNSVKELTETVVFQGKMELITELRSDPITDDINYINIQFQAEHMQCYTAEGQFLTRPVQILEPADVTVVVTKSTKDGFNECIEIKAVTLTPVDITFSMRNAALIEAISSSIKDFLRSSSSEQNTSMNIDVISDDEVMQLEKLSKKLNSAVANEDMASEVGSLHELQLSRHSVLSQESMDPSIRRIKVTITLPYTQIAIINDLQGLDLALFKLIAQNVVGGGDFKGSSSSINAPLKFDIHMNTTLLADYFDSSTHTWESLLAKPWELTMSSRRVQEKKYKSSRMQTMLDIESHPCHVSFSEQFLVGIGAALQMWAMYTSATTNVGKDDPSNHPLLENKQELHVKDEAAFSIRQSMAANAARILVTTMPYGIDNHSGINIEFSITNGEDVKNADRTVCQAGTIQYFRFTSPRSSGMGGKRLYGKDVKYKRSLYIFIGKKTIYVDHVDAQVKEPREAHDLGSGRFIFTQFVNNGKATILHITSYMHLYNGSNIPFSIAVQNDDGIHDVGVINGKARSKVRSQTKSISRKKRNDESDRSMLRTKYPSSLGIPIDLLQRFFSEGASKTDLLICPHVSDCGLNSKDDRTPRASLSLVDSGGMFHWGAVSLPSLHKLIALASSDSPMESVDVTCSIPTDDMYHRGVGNDVQRGPNDSLCVQVCWKVSLVNEMYPFVEIFVQPRALLENRLPISILITTPMPYCFSPPNEDGICPQSTLNRHDETTLQLEPSQALEIFSNGPSVAVKTKPADSPSAGNVLDWAEEWIDIPLGRERRLSEPMKCIFPFQKILGEYTPVGGSEFYVVESNSFKQGDRSFLPHDFIRLVSITIENYAVDHLGYMLFEAKRKEKGISEFEKHRKNSSSRNRSFVPWSAFLSTQKTRRITLLPKSNIHFRMVELTIEHAEGCQKSIPFKVDDVSICLGGAESTAILWENKKESGYYAYRQLRSFGQSEIHIIPEYICWNGSTENSIVVKQPRGNHFALGPGELGPLSRDKSHGVIIMIEAIEIEASTSPIQVDSLGIKICLVKSSATGKPLGSVAIQTVVGGRDSRLVVKIGAIKFGGKERTQGTTQASGSISTFTNDFLRFRIRWTELKISLSDTELKKKDAVQTNCRSNSEEPSTAIAALVFRRFTVDYQRIFKEGTNQIISSERSQVAIIVHNMRILDCTESSKHPIVFDGFTKNSVFDLCARFRGPLDAELIKVELIDLNIAYNYLKKKELEKIVLNASEKFIWRLLDVTSRIMNAISDIAGSKLDLVWDEENQEFVASIVDGKKGVDYMLNEENTMNYQPPQNDSLLDVKTARVSPFNLSFSFLREPEASRYFQRARTNPAARLMNYFTTRLKFTIDGADLKFPGYVARNLKGPPDRVIDTFSVFYVSKLKQQFFSLLTAVSFKDWKNLTNRSGGDEDYVEGDILRLSGSMLGKSTGFVIKKVGAEIGDGFSNLTKSVGNEFEREMDRKGAGAVGRSVNSVVSGVGEGIGGTFTGLAKGTGNVVRGTLGGAGQILGGLGGSVELAAKGIGTGISKGDGSAVLTGFGDGAKALTNGVGHGLETAGQGVIDGVVNVRDGLFSGVQSIGKGIGGAFVPGKKGKKNSERELQKKRHF